MLICHQLQKIKLLCSRARVIWSRAVSPFSDCALRPRNILEIYMYIVRGFHPAQSKHATSQYDVFVSEMMCIFDIFFYIPFCVISY